MVSGTSQTSCHPRKPSSSEWPATTAMASSSRESLASCSPTSYQVRAAYYWESHSLSLFWFSALRHSKDHCRTCRMSSHNNEINHFNIIEMSLYKVMCLIMRLCLQEPQKLVCPPPLRVTTCRRVNSRARSTVWSPSPYTSAERASAWVWTSSSGALFWYDKYWNFSGATWYILSYS